MRDPFDTLPDLDQENQGINANLGESSSQTLKEVLASKPLQEQSQPKVRASLSSSNPGDKAD